ncbi:MAG: outer membrane lipoprotein-sorting protein [Nitrospinota bacterium]|nr:outer membrane lipoprotein-sorting protein [Nitrospinota bacterium]
MRQTNNENNMENIMRIAKSSILMAFVAMAAAMAILPRPALADDPKAREIMQKVEDRDEGDNATTEMEMTLIDKNGSQRLRKLKTFTKYFGEDRYRLMFFLHPADVKDTGFLTYDYDDPAKSDDQWLYLPALRKSKRIATEDKSGSFMGSDFTYYDMTRPNTVDYDYKLLKEDVVEGNKVWVIEAIPRRQEIIDESGYTKRVSFVRQDNYFVIRAVNWLKDGGKLRYLEVKDLQQIDGIWTALEIHMTTKAGNVMTHKTTLKFNGMKYNQKLDDEMFTVRVLEKGL